MSDRFSDSRSSLLLSEFSDEIKQPESLGQSSSCVLFKEIFGLKDRGTDSFSCSWIPVNGKEGSSYVYIYKNYACIHSSFSYFNRSNLDFITMETYGSKLHDCLL